MRGAVLAELLTGLDPDVAARVVATIVLRGRQGGPPFELALSGLEEMLRSERLTYEQLVDLYRRLKKQHGDLAALLLPGRSPQEILGVPGPRVSGERELTLGERKSLARAANRDLIDRLLRDPEPQVIRLLLRNPRLVERDVIFLASRRPIRGEIVREIMACSRWMNRYHVKRTILLNPEAPEELASRLLPFLTRTDLRQLATDPALSPVRRHQARLLLDRGRDPTPQPHQNGGKEKA